MHLKRLTLDLQEYGKQKGQYEIVVEYVHHGTETKLNLPPALVRGLLELISKNIIEASTETARLLATSLPEDIIKTSPQIEANTHRAITEGEA